MFVTTLLYLKNQLNLTDQTTFGNLKEIATPSYENISMPSIYICFSRFNELYIFFPSLKVH